MLRVLRRAARHQQCAHGRSPVPPRMGRNGLFQHDRQRRAFADLPTVLVPPAVFGGLFIALWTWKCCMMVLFQNKIIYMPSLPPNARWETIANYQSQCSGISWREERIRSGDGTRISLCVASVESSSAPVLRKVYILYFQGNASSLPPRLPFLSPVLRMLRDKQPPLPVQYIMVCCSYRGYWTSKGRPSEKGILQDAAAALNWIREVEETSSDEGDKQPVSVIIWGQSIGAGVATNLAAQQALFSERLALKMLILETPFLSIRAMLETIYPQKWLPYRHLWPFLRNHLDSWEALGVLQENATRHKVTPPNVVIVEAERDELVPASHGDMLERRCLELGLKVRKQSIPTALHNEVLVRPGGRTAMVEAIRQASGEAPSTQPKG